MQNRPFLPRETNNIYFPALNTIIRMYKNHSVNAAFLTVLFIYFAPFGHSADIRACKTPEHSSHSRPLGTQSTLALKAFKELGHSQE